LCIILSYRKSNTLTYRKFTVFIHGKLISNFYYRVLVILGDFIYLTGHLNWIYPSSFSLIIHGKLLIRANRNILFILLLHLRKLPSINYHIAKLFPQNNTL
jgi:hypothetical protein